MGTRFTYIGTNCNPSSGIYFKSESPGGGAWGKTVVQSWSWRQREILKETGQFYFLGNDYMLQGNKFKIQIDPGQINNLDVYVHELGHTIGLHEQYKDVTTPDCSVSSDRTVMDCYGSTPGVDDDYRLGTRWELGPWGSGAIWITSDTGTSLYLNWADINDNETSQKVYKNGALLGTSSRNTQSRYVGGLAPGANDCFYVRPTNANGSSSSSTICRQSQPGAPAAPSSVSASYYGGTHYQANVQFYNNASNATHFTVYTYRSDWTLQQAYYLPYEPVGWVGQVIKLGMGDPLSQTYHFEAYTCNQKYNPWNSPYCTYGGSDELYMYP